MFTSQANESVQTNGADQGHLSSARSIFRAEALQHYLENQERVALPPMVSPQFFRYLWIAAGWLAAVGLLLACWPWIGAWTTSLISWWLG